MELHRLEYSKIIQTLPVRIKCLIRYKEYSFRLLSLLQVVKWLDLNLGSLYIRSIIWSIMLYLMEIIRALVFQFSISRYSAVINSKTYQTCKEHHIQMFLQKNNLTNTLNSLQTQCNR